jgi:hypothetical protein
MTICVLKCNFCLSAFVHFIVWIDSGQLHSSDASTTKESTPGTILNVRLSGPQSQPGYFWREKNLLPLPATQQAPLSLRFAIQSIINLQSFGAIQIWTFQSASFNTKTYHQTRRYSSHHFIFNLCREAPVFLNRILLGCFPLVKSFTQIGRTNTLKQATFFPICHTYCSQSSSRRYAVLQLRGKLTE